MYSIRQVKAWSFTGYLNQIKMEDNSKATKAKNSASAGKSFLALMNTNKNLAQDYMDEWVLSEKKDEVITPDIKNPPVQLRIM